MAQALLGTGAGAPAAPPDTRSVKSHRARRRFWTLVAGFFAVACGDGEAAPGSGAAAPAEPATPQVYGAAATENVRAVPLAVEVRDLPEGWDGMKIAAVSDFKLGRWHDNAAVAEAAVRRAVSSGADLVVLLGDFVESEDQLPALERALAPLQGRPAFAVLGDNDAREEPGATPDSAEIRLVETLRRAGVTVLRNERAPFARGGDTAFIGGVEPFTVRRPEWRQAEIFNSVAGSTVLLSHVPGVLARLPFAQRIFPLILAGDTGCGLVEPPGTVGLTRLRNEILPGALLPGTDRAFRVGRSTLAITCGVGYSYIPVRVGVPPEVLMVTLRRVSERRQRESAEPLVPDSLLQQFQVGDTAATDTAAPARPPRPAATEP